MSAAGQGRGQLLSSPPPRPVAPPPLNPRAPASSSSPSLPPVSPRGMEGGGLASGNSGVRGVGMGGAAGAAVGPGGGGGGGGGPCEEFQAGSGWRKKNVCSRCGLGQKEHAEREQQQQQAAAKPPPSSENGRPGRPSGAPQPQGPRSIAAEIAAGGSMRGSPTRQPGPPAGGGSGGSMRPISYTAGPGSSPSVYPKQRSLPNLPPPPTQPLPSAPGATAGGGGTGGPQSVNNAAGGGLSGSGSHVISPPSPRGPGKRSMSNGTNNPPSNPLPHVAKTGHASAFLPTAAASDVAAALAHGGFGKRDSTGLRPSAAMNQISRTANSTAPRKRSGLGAEWSPLLTAADPHALAMSTYFRTLSHLLRVMDLKEETLSEIEGIAARGRLNKPAQEAPIARPIAPETRKLLETVISDLSGFLDVNYKLGLIIRGQSLIRRYLARKRFKAMKQTFLLGPLKARNDGFREIVRKERAYVENLRAVVKDYMEPLRENAKGLRALCTAQEITTIFGNAETLLTVHSELMNQLNNIQARWPEVDGIGEVFLTMAPFFKAYGDYVNNFQKAVDTLFQCQQKDRFASFLNEIFERGQKKGVFVDLHGLLSAPLNHISGYESLLQTLLENTPPEHKDYKSLSHCFSIISGTCKYICESLASADNMRNIQAVQDKLSLEKGDTKPLTLTGDHNRRFTKEGPCNILSELAKKSSKEKGYLFVFNDLVLITSPHKSVYKVLDRLEVAECAIELANDPSPDTQLFAITLSSGTRKYHLSFTSQKERAEWHTLIKRLISYYEKNKVFGSPLSRLCSGTATGIPHIVERLAAHLDSCKAYELEGVFRISGNASQVNFIRDSFDRAGIGMEPDINLAMSSPHEISGVFKMFFRELPEPLFAFDVYEPLLRVVSQFGVDGNVDVALTEIAKLVQSLPKEHRDVLLYLLDYLGKYVAHAARTKMTAANLAIVFSPNICRPRQETIDYSLQLGKINTAVELMLVHADKLRSKLH